MFISIQNVRILATFLENGAQSGRGFYGRVKTWQSTIVITGSQSHEQVC